MKTFLTIAFACAMILGKRVNAITSFHSPKFLVVTAISVFAVAWCVSTSMDAQAQQPVQATLQLLKDAPQDYVGKRIIIFNCTIGSDYQREKKLFDGYVFNILDDSANILPNLSVNEIAFVARKRLGAKIVEKGINIGKSRKEFIIKTDNGRSTFSNMKPILELQRNLGLRFDGGANQMPFCNVLVSVTKLPTGEFLATFVSIEGKDHLNRAYVLK